MPRKNGEKCVSKIGKGFVPSMAIDLCVEREVPKCDVDYSGSVRGSGLVLKLAVPELVQPTPGCVDAEQSMRNSVRNLNDARAMLRVVSMPDFAA